METTAETHPMERTGRLGHLSFRHTTEELWPQHVSDIPGATLLQRSNGSLVSWTCTANGRPAFGFAESGGALRLSEETSTCSEPVAWGTRAGKCGESRGDWAEGP